MKLFPAMPVSLSRFYIASILVMSLVLQACTQADKERTLDTLNIAILPDQSEAIIRHKYQPLLDYLASYCGIKTQLLVPDSYAELLDWFGSKKIDMALFGGVTFVKAHLSNNAMPLVMRDVDGTVRSVVLVREKSSLNSLAELNGATVAFGSRLSTSGHYMPRYFLKKLNLIPETFFGSIDFTGAHDLTAEWVRDGKVDAGVAHSGIVKEMFMDGRLTRDKVKVIWESAQFSDYMWAIQADINQQQVTQFRDAFLSLNYKPENSLLLKMLGANYYVPASYESFLQLEEVVLQANRQESSR